MRISPITTLASLIAAVEAAKNDEKIQWYVSRVAQARGWEEHIPASWVTGTNKVTSFRDYTPDEQQSVQEPLSAMAASLQSYAAGDIDRESLFDTAWDTHSAQECEGRGELFTSGLVASLNALVTYDRISSEDSEALVAAIKKPRKVRTPAGEKRFGQPIGSIITPGGKTLKPGDAGYDKMNALIEGKPVKAEKTADGKTVKARLDTSSSGDKTDSSTSSNRFDKMSDSDLEEFVRVSKANQQSAVEGGPTGKADNVTAKHYGDAALAGQKEIDRRSAAKKSKASAPDKTSKDSASSKSSPYSSMSDADLDKAMEKAKRNHHQISIQYGDDAAAMYLKQQDAIKKEQDKRAAGETDSTSTPSASKKDELKSRASKAFAGPADTATPDSSSKASAGDSAPASTADDDLPAGATKVAAKTAKMKPAQVTHPGFVTDKQKSLGDEIRGLSSKDPRWKEPKTTLADGHTPAAGDKVVDHTGRTGTVKWTEQRYTRVTFDDGTVKTLVNHKLNKLSTGEKKASTPVLAPAPATYAPKKADASVPKKAATSAPATTSTAKSATGTESAPVGMSKPVSKPASKPASRSTAGTTNTAATTEPAVKSRIAPAPSEYKTVDLIPHSITKKVQQQFAGSDDRPDAKDIMNLNDKQLGDMMDLGFDHDYYDEGVYKIFGTAESWAEYYARQQGVTLSPEQRERVGKMTLGSKFRPTENMTHEQYGEYMIDANDGLDAANAKLDAKRTAKKTSSSGSKPKDAEAISSIEDAMKTMGSQGGYKKVNASVFDKIIAMSDGEVSPELKNAARRAKVALANVKKARRARRSITDKQIDMRNYLEARDTVNKILEGLKDGGSGKA